MKSVLALLFSPMGCVGRGTWWASLVVWWTVLILVAHIEGEDSTAGPLFLTALAIGFWPMMVIQIKRWHDRGKSGFWCLIVLVPFIGSLWALIELGFLGATDDPSNEYYRGLDPWK